VLFRSAAVERIRYGLVAQGGTSQKNPLTLYFDRARVGTSAAGPLGGSTPVPTPTPTPSPAPSPSPTPSPAPAPPANAAPKVAITSPTAGAHFTRSLLLQADASDDSRVAKVEFRIDGNLVATENIAPYSITVNTRRLADGTHTVTATAYDAAGLKTSTSVQAVKGTALSAVVTRAATGAQARRAAARSSVARDRCAVRVLKGRHTARATRRAARQAAACHVRVSRALLRRALRHPV